MRLKIEYYGHIREQVQKSVEDYNTSCSTISALLQEIQKLHHIKSPASYSRSGVAGQPFIIAINANLVQPTEFNIPNLFKEGDSVAIMPPFAGG